MKIFRQIEPQIFATFPTFGQFPSKMNWIELFAPLFCSLLLQMALFGFVYLFSPQTKNQKRIPNLLSVCPIESTWFWSGALPINRIFRNTNIIYLRHSNNAHSEHHKHPKLNIFLYKQGLKYPGIENCPYDYNKKAKKMERSECIAKN